MDSEIKAIQGDIRTLFRLIDAQIEDSKNLTSLATSIKVIAKEMEYLREDIRSIKKDNEFMKSQLNEHMGNDMKDSIDNYNYYKKEITKWFVLLILGTVAGVLLKGVV